MGANSLAITASKCRSCPIQDFCHDKKSESEKFLKTPYSIIGLPKFEIPDLEVIDFPVSIVRDIYRLVEINSKIEGVSFLDFPENKSDKVVEIMKKEQFEKAKEIQEQLEFFRSARDSISKTGSEVRISWEESNYYGGSTDRAFWIRNCDMGEIRTVLLNYFISRISELEKEFEAL